MDLEIRAEKGEPSLLMRSSPHGRVSVPVQLYHLSFQVPFAYEGDLIVVERQRYARIRKITVHDSLGNTIYEGPLANNNHEIEDPLLAALGGAAAGVLESPYKHFERFLNLTNGTVTIDPADHHQGKLALEGIVAYSVERPS